MTTSGRSASSPASAAGVAPALHRRAPQVPWPPTGSGQADVVCPGFSADCLETLEEIAVENAGYFTEAGGERLSYIPALNARADHVSFLTQLVLKNLRGWPEVSPGFRPDDRAAELAESAAIAVEAGGR